MFIKAANKYLYEIEPIEYEITVAKVNYRSRHKKVGTKFLAYRILSSKMQESGQKSIHNFNNKDHWKYIFHLDDCWELTNFPNGSDAGYFTVKMIWDYKKELSSVEI